MSDWLIDDLVRQMRERQNAAMEAEIMALPPLNPNTGGSFSVPLSPEEAERIRAELAPSIQEWANFPRVDVQGAMYAPAVGDRVMVEDMQMALYGLGTVRLVGEQADPLVNVELDETGVTWTVRASRTLTKLRVPPKFASVEEADAWLDAAPCKECGDPDDHHGVPHSHAQKGLRNGETVTGSTKVTYS